MYGAIIKKGKTIIEFPSTYLLSRAKHQNNQFCVQRDGAAIFSQSYATGQYKVTWRTKVAHMQFVKDVFSFAFA